MTRTVRLVVAAALFAVPLSRGLPASATGWTWKNPLPAGTRLTTVCATSAGDVLVSGFESTSMKRIEAGWHSLFAAAKVQIGDSWAGAAGGVFATGYDSDAGAGRLLRFDGRIWNDAGTFDAMPQALWGFSSTDLWILGTGTKLLEPVVASWNGSVFTVEVVAKETVFPSGIWGTASDDLWVLGQTLTGAGRLFHRTAAGWGAEALPVASDPSDELTSLRLWGAGRGQPVVAAWSAGLPGLRVFQKGNSGWEELTSSPGLYATAMAGSADGKLAVAANDVKGEETVVLVREGGTWKREKAGTARQLFQLRWNGSRELWAVGDSGTVLLRDASGWKDLAPARRDDLGDLVRESDGSLTLCANEPISGQGRILRWGADGFTTVESEAGTTLQRLRAGSDGLLRAVGTDWNAEKGVVWTRSGTWTKEAVTEAGVGLWDVFASSAGLLAGGADLPPDPTVQWTTARLYRKGADGKWASEYSSPEPRGFQFLSQIATGSPIAITI